MIPCSAEFVNGSENSLFLFFSDTLSAISFNLRCSQTNVFILKNRVKYAGEE